MLISFTVENVKSFASTATLSMRAHKSDKTLAGSLLSDASGGDPLLPAAAIYGANAAGKTNMIVAADYMRQTVLRSQGIWRPGSGTRRAPHASQLDKPSLFEIEFVSDGTQYRYGFLANDNYFADEWLYARVTKKERRLFYRTTTVADDQSFKTFVKFSSAFEGSPIDKRSWVKRTRADSLFLSCAAQDEQRDIFPVYKWFLNKLIVYGPDGTDRFPNGDITSSMWLDFPPFRRQLLPLLKMADDGIQDLSVVKKESEGMPRSMLFDLRPSHEVTAYKVNFQINTDGQTYWLPIESQSKGIKRIYDFAAAVIFALQAGEVLIIDELESSLHPIIAANILSLFKSPSTNPEGGQIIFTTHDTGLLRSDLLRRDEVWFVEKHNGCSELYSLLEFSPRKDEALEGGYLRGRYGAIPTRGIDPAWLTPSEQTPYEGAVSISEADQA